MLFAKRQICDGFHVSPNGLHDLRCGWFSRGAGKSDDTPGPHEIKWYFVHYLSLSSAFHGKVELRAPHPAHEWTPSRVIPETGRSLFTLSSLYDLRTLAYGFGYSCNLNARARGKSSCLRDGPCSLPISFRSKPTFSGTYMFLGISVGSICDGRVDRGTALR